jgi:cell division protein FtsW
MVFIPGIGIEVWGATRWIDVGPFSFQPSEFLKITFILYMASWLTTRTSLTKNFQKTQKGINENLIAFLVIISLISLFLIFQPNISTLTIIILTTVLLYFLAKTPLWHTVLILFIGISIFITLIKIAPYRLERLTVFLNPGIDPMGIGFQMQQALIAIGSGGILGAGLGMGIQKFGFLPGVISDSIFAVFAEEAGFIGGLILISLFLIFLWRGFRIAKLSQNKFSQLTAYGITIWIIIQAFVNISSMLGVLPLTGIPLPFISHGGTALITALVGIGILLNISKQT